MLYDEIVKRWSDKDMLIEEPEETPTTTDKETIPRFSEAVVDSEPTVASIFYEYFMKK